MTTRGRRHNPKGCECYGGGEKVIGARGSAGARPVQGKHRELAYQRRKDARRKASNEPTAQWRHSSRPLIGRRAERRQAWGEVSPLIFGFSVSLRVVQGAWGSDPGSSRGLYAVDVLSIR